MDALSSDQEIRLECIKLTYRHDRSPDDIIARASDLSAFVVGKRSPASARKKADLDG